MNRDRINKLLNEIEDLVKHDSYLLNNNDQDSLYTKIQNLRNSINETYIKRGSENVE